MPTFKENLDTFPAIEGIVRLELLDAAGKISDRIENKPGSQGSVRLYLHLARQFGSITPEAAEQGVALYAEHADDALMTPGKHPNIDRLLDLIEHQQTLTVRIVAS